MSDKAFAGVKLDFDAVVDQDDKLKKGVADWPTMVGWAVEWINKGLVALGREEIDDAAILAPGEIFDGLMVFVRNFKATTPRAMAIKAGLVWFLDYIHKFVHPLHVNAAGA